MFFLRYRQDPPATPSLLKFLPPREQPENSSQSSLPLISPTLFSQSPSHGESSSLGEEKNFKQSKNVSLDDLMMSVEDELDFVERTPEQQTSNYPMVKRVDNLILTSFGREFYSSIKRKIALGSGGFGSSTKAQSGNLFSLTPSKKSSLGKDKRGQASQTGELVALEESQNVFVLAADDDEGEKENIFSSLPIISQFQSNSVLKREGEIGKVNLENENPVGKKKKNNTLCPQHGHSIRACDKDSPSTEILKSSPNNAFSPGESANSSKSHLNASIETFTNDQKSKDSSPHTDDSITSGKAIQNHNSKTIDSISISSSVWLRIKNNEFRIGNLLDYSDATKLFTIKVYGFKSHLQAPKRDLILCKHNVGDLIICPKGYFSVIVEVGHAGKQFEIVRLDKNYSKALALDLDSIMYLKDSSTVHYYDIYLNNLLFKQRHGIYIFSNWSFMITMATDCAMQRSMDKKTIEKIIRENGGTIISAKDNLSSLEAFIQSSSSSSWKKTILLATEPKRTIKYIFAISKDIPRIDISWLDACIKAGEFVSFTAKKSFILPNSKETKTKCLNRSLFAPFLFYLEGSSSFCAIWGNIIESFSGRISSSMEPYSILVQEEQHDKREGECCSMFNRIVNSIISQSNCIT